jgi:DNA-binding response OmpR family regulator/DNA-binding CsgD family transcriptional regulator
MTKRHILLVDDEPTSLELLTRLLKRTGYELYFAANGADALKAMEKTAFDLVLLDVRMAGMSGHAVAEAARRLPAGADVPILFLSGETDPKSILAGFKAGGQDYITKPFCEEEVLARVRAQIELRDNRVRLEELVAERTIALERKNIALAEVLDSIQGERERSRLEINEKIETLVQPVVERLKSGHGPVARELVELLLKHLDELFSPIVPKMAEMRSLLTAQEYEIACLVRSGAPSKAIAEALRISVETVKWHRANIRKKLGLSDRSRNLADHIGRGEKNGA